MIQNFRNVLEQLIRTGIYVKASSPHNNPVMLIEQKQPSQYHSIVDNWLVNAECTPASIFTGTHARSMSICNAGMQKRPLQPPARRESQALHINRHSGIKTVSTYENAYEGESIDCSFVPSYDRNDGRHSIYLCFNLSRQLVFIESLSSNKHIRYIDVILFRLGKNESCNSQARSN